MRMRIGRSDVLACWGTGVLGYWDAGVLGYWGIGLRDTAVQHCASGGPFQGTRCQNGTVAICWFGGP